MSYLLENRTILFALSLILLFLSCLGPEGVPFKQYLFSNKIDELYRLLEKTIFEKKEIFSIVEKIQDKCPLIMDLDALPDTPYELLDIPKYNAADLGNGISASFQTSRGCPFACKFCGNEILQQRKMRSISVPKLVAKIKMLQSKYGYNSF